MAFECGTNTDTFKAPFGAIIFNLIHARKLPRSSTSAELPHRQPLSIQVVLRGLSMERRRMALRPSPLQIWTICAGVKFGLVGKAKCYAPPFPFLYAAESRSRRWLALAGHP